MKLTIKSVSLRNFKGIRKLDIKPDGKNCSLIGDMGTGKTSVLDAIPFLFDDKSADGSADFGIKTQIDGKILHNLEHSASVDFDGDGQPLILSKVFHEVYSIKNGAASDELIGHSTDHYINGVKQKTKAAYLQKIKSMIGPDLELFRILTIPSYFATKVKWEKRRQIVCEVCKGAVTDDDVLSDPTFIPLKKAMDNRTVDEHMAYCKDTLAVIDKEQKEFVARFDENDRLSKTEIDTTEKEKDLQTSKSVLESLQKKLVRLTEGGEISGLKKELADIHTHIAKINRDHGDIVFNKVNEIRKNIYECETSKRRAEGEIYREEQKICDSVRNYECNIWQIEKLRNDYKGIFTEKFMPWDTCPTCTTKWMETPECYRSNAEGLYNIQKSASLESIQIEGKALRADNALLVLGISEIEGKLYQLETDIKNNDAAVQVYNAEILKVQSSVPNIDGYDRLLSDKVEINKKISSLMSGDIREEIKQVQADIAGTEAEIKNLMADIAKVSAAKDARDRIIELEARQKELAVQAEKLESEQSLLKEFYRRKIALQTARIKDYFAVAGFKMYENQINGGIKDCCIVTGEDGVEFDVSMNTGQRTAVGLDIIKTLSRYYNLYLPVLIDDANLITRYPEMENQVIKAVVLKDAKLQLHREEI